MRARYPVAVAAIASVAAVALNAPAPGSRERAASGCSASIVRHFPVKIPGLSELPWLLAKPRAVGLPVSLVTYLSTLHDSRVNASPGAVLWTRGEKIAWTRPNDAAAAVLTGQRLDGAGSFTLALEPSETVFFATLRFPSAGCWKLTLRGGGTSSSVVVR